MMHVKWMFHALIEGIRTIKTFIKYKRYYYWYIYLKQKHKITTTTTKSPREHCGILSSLWQNKNYYTKGTQHQLPIFFQKISNFCCKIKIFVAFHIYFPSNITLVLGFMISNKSYYVQTVSVNSKDVSCKIIKLRNFRSFFKFWFSCYKSL